VAPRALRRHSVTGGIRKVLSRLPRRDSVVEAGVGLVDVLVAITVLMVVMLPAAYLIDSTVQQTASAREQVSATELAEQELETLNNEPLTQLEAWLDQTVVQSTQTVAGQSYKVSTYLTWQGVGSEPDLCSSGSPPQSISASAIVSWGSAPINSLAEQSVIDPPYTQPSFTLSTALTSGHVYTSITATTSQTISAGSTLTIGAGTSQDQTVTVPSNQTGTTIAVTSFTANATYPYETPVALPDEGFIGVQVDGVSGSAPTGVTAVSVQVTSVTTGAVSTYYPDSNGCVYEEELPGTYYVTLGSYTTPPFVDQYENAAPSTQNLPYSEQVVTAGSATIWTATYNQGGKVNFVPSGGVAVAGGTPVSVGNTGIPTSSWATVVAAGSSTTSATLYPFTSSYSVWYGDCLAEEPASASTVSAVAGGTSSVSISGLVNLTVEPVSNATGTTAYPGATVTATVADPVSADACPSDVLTLPTSSTSVTQPEAAVVETSRSDAGSGTTISTDKITDPSIATTDQGKQVTGPGIPAGSYVGTVTAGASFLLWKSPVSSGGTQNATATGTNVTIVLTGETYTVNVQGAANPVHITINPGGVVCTSGCITTQVGTFIASGSALKVQA
jgi:Tfp pilus assembly protein PilV